MIPLIRQFRFALPVLPAVASVAAAREPGEADAVEQTSMTLGQIVQTGGWPMYVLAAMSVAAVAFIIYFFVVLRAEQVAPRALADRLRSQLGADDLDAARKTCAGSKAPLASVVGAGLEHLRRTGDRDPYLLKDVMEGEGGRQASLIQNQTQYLLDIAVIAPMVGLLGTVIGMLSAFNTVALDIAKARPMLLAAGVSQALITTAAGLIVGIPAMMFYAYFRGRSSKLIAQFEATSADLLSLLTHKRREPES